MQVLFESAIALWNNPSRPKFINGGITFAAVIVSKFAFEWFFKSSMSPQTPSEKLKKRSFCVLAGGTVGSAVGIALDVVGKMPSRAILITSTALIAMGILFSFDVIRYFKERRDGNNPPAPPPPPPPPPPHSDPASDPKAPTSLAAAITAGRKDLKKTAAPAPPPKAKPPPPGGVPLPGGGIDPAAGLKRLRQTGGPASRSPQRDDQSGASNELKEKFAHLSPDPKK